MNAHVASGKLELNHQCVTRVRMHTIMIVLRRFKLLDLDFLIGMLATTTSMSGMLAMRNVIAIIPDILVVVKQIVEDEGAGIEEEEGVEDEGVSGVEKEEGVKEEGVENEDVTKTPFSSLAIFLG